MKMLTRMCVLPIFLALLLQIPKAGFAQGSDETSAGPCDCPAKDSMAKPTCGPEPKKLRTKIFSKEECSTANTSIGVASQKVATAVVDALSDYKNPTETLSYLSCYRDPSSDKRFCHYKTTLASHIALAAEVSGLPFAVQSCLFFRESNFNPDARSPVGAMGYVQFMPDTLDSITTIIYGKISDWQENIDDANKDLIDPRANLAAEQAKSDKIASLNKRITENTNKIARIDRQLKTEQIPGRKLALKEERNNLEADLNEARGELKIAPLPNQKKMTSYKKTINYYETLINTWSSRIAAKRVWDNYWEGSDKLPTKFSNESLKCPQVAFALAAVKQTYDLGLIKGINKDWNPQPIMKENDQYGISINGMNERDSAIMLGGAYNAGIGGLGSRCGAARSLDECSKKFTKGKETWVYMNSVKHCSEKNGTESMRYNAKTGKWTGKKDCEASKCEQ